MSRKRTKDHLAVVFEEYHRRTGETVLQRNTRRIAEQVAHSPDSNTPSIADEGKATSFGNVAHKAHSPIQKPTDNK